MKFRASFVQATRFNQTIAPIVVSPGTAAMDRLSYLYLMEDIWRGMFYATEVALKPKVLSILSSQRELERVTRATCA